MNAAVAHRGPDGEDIWCGEDAAFGQRRLSIIDLSPAGSQPMRSADGRLVLVCNGEIYNYKDIRRRFVAEGYPFRSQTDVEVILPLYEKYGECCVDHLVGMFAFAVWDQRERTLFLARDRIGEKPLYLWTDRKAIAFCSEIKGLLQLPFVERKLDERALAHLPMVQSLPAPLTMFAGIEELPPATTLTWTAGRRRQQHYWRLDFSRRRRWLWSDALEAYDAVLQRSVDGCLIADVPIGLTLSGGVDSSAVATMASRSRADVRSFCIGHMTDGKPDVEQRRADRVASILGLRHANLHFDPPQLSDLARVLRQYDQPIWNSTVLYADRLAEAMRREVKVAVGGNGADEVLAGYAGYSRIPFEATLRRVMSALPAGLRGRIDAAAPERIGRLAQSSAGPMPSWRAQALAEDARRQLRRLCTPAAAERLLAVDIAAPARAYALECAPTCYLDTVLCTDLMVYHRHSHCTIADVSGMTYGLEIRAPFLDHRFVEFAASLPTDMLLSLLPSRRRTKWIAKRHLERYLPPDLVQAPKLGFGYGIPVNDILFKANGEEVRRRLTQGAYLDLGIVSRAGAEWALANSLGATWMLLSLSVWADLYLFGAKPVADENRPPRKFPVLH